MKARTRNQRLFLKFLKTHRDQFKHPIRVNRIVYGCLHFNFIGITPAIEGTVSFSPNYSSVNIGVMWNKQFWDLLFETSLVPKKSNQGWFCELCLPEFVNYYPTKEELLIQHNFVSFKDWVNGTLSDSNWLELRSFKSNSTAAVLLKTREDFQKITKYKHESGCSCQLINVMQ